MEQALAGQFIWPVYLWGATGTGKTCAALATTDRVKSAWYVTAEQLADAAHWDGDEWIWQRIRRADLVAIDELGSNRWDSQREYRGVFRAAELRQNRPTIWIGNHGPERLADVYDDRIQSRICCGTVIELSGSDRRFLK